MKILFLALLMILTGCAANPQSTKTEQPKASPTIKAESQPIEISAAELYQAYEKNEVAANDLYKGKPLVISGTIENISQDPSGQMYVMLKSEKQFSFTDVQCYFPNDRKAEITRLEKGQKVKIKCTGAGKSLNVEARECGMM